MLVKCTIFILLKLAYFDMKNKGTGNKSQSIDEILYILLYVTVSAKTILNGTFIITRKTDLKYSSCCGSVVLDFATPDLQYN